MNDYTDLIEYLREMHDVMLYDDSAESGVSEEMITDIDAIACKEAADAIEQLVKERDELTTKCCRLEQERDAAVAAVHKQCSTCKIVDFCATDAGQPTLWACVSAAKCNWEWRGLEDNDGKID